MELTSRFSRQGPFGSEGPLGVGASQRCLAGEGSTVERLLHWGWWPLCRLMLKHWGAVTPARGPHGRESSGENSPQTSGDCLERHCVLISESRLPWQAAAVALTNPLVPTSRAVGRGGGEAETRALGPDSSLPAVSPGRRFGPLARRPTDRLTDRPTGFDRFNISHSLSSLVCDP